MLRALLALLVGVVALVATTPAAAHCRKTTSSDSSELGDPSRSGQCEPGGPGALPLFWARSCVEYRVVVDPALEAKGILTAARAAALVHQATSAWNATTCPSGSGPARPVAIRTVDVAEGRCEGQVWSTHNEVRFTTEPSDGDTLGVTDVTFDGASGGVLTAVTRVFDVYADLGATPAEVDPRLEYIVRHEMGHFLGLAHSEQRASVMNASFRDLPGDGLTADDQRGICDAYSPDAPVGAGCSVGPRDGARGDLAPRAVVVALALVALLRRARRRPRLADQLRLLAIPLLLALPGIASATPPRAAPTSTSIRAPRPKKTLQPAATTSDPKPVSQLTDDELVHLRPDTIPEAPRAPAAPRPEPARPAAKTLAMKVVVPDDAPTPREPDVASGPPSPRRDLYLGAGYRAFVLLRAMTAAFGRASSDPVFHAVSARAELHATRGLSLVPALTFADLSTGDLLVGARDGDRAASFSYLRSDLKALAASVELVWSLPVSRRVELEVGLELGAGITFGSLVDTWVHEAADGPLAYGGRRFAPCRTVNDGPGCRPQDHASPSIVKVGDYREPGLFAGGSAPTLLPWVSLPLLGVRTRIGDDLALRVGVGASATGLWAGASLGYRVARREAP